MKIRIAHPVLRDFFEQLRFAPKEQKQKQLAASENLLMTLDPDRQYPMDFIIFRITGYRSKDFQTHELVSGNDLYSALRLWIADLSGQLDLIASEQGQRVYTTGELSQRFAVSSKTIQRWQRRGLNGKLYVFADGRKKKGFTELDVECFVQKNSDLIDKAAAFTLSTEQDKQDIYNRAMLLAREHRSWSRNKIVLKLAVVLNRSKESIRLILADKDKVGRGKSEIPPSRANVSPKEAAQVYKLNKQGVRITELMVQFNRSRSSIYRMINQQRAKELFSRKIEYIDSVQFLEDNAEEMILGPSLEELTGQVEEEVAGQKKKLLNRQQEIELFRKYNYLKYSICLERTKIRPGQPSSRRLKLIEQRLDEAEQVKKQIIEANMPLVVNIAGKHLKTGAVMSELVSEGSLSLMRAVEKFDYLRGYRFSTYASWVIAKDFARKIPREAARRDMTIGSDFANYAEDYRVSDIDFDSVEQAHRSLRKVIEDNLDDRERFVVLNHFALDEEVIRKKPMTLKQIGDELGLSKERIRQIELQALHKLRQNLSPEQFDLLTG